MFPTLQDEIIIRTGKGSYTKNVTVLRSLGNSIKIFLNRQKCEILSNGDGYIGIRVKKGETNDPRKNLRNYGLAPTTLTTIKKFEARWTSRISTPMDPNRKT